MGMMGLIEWVRRMFGYTEYKTIAGTDIAMSQSMIEAINLWQSMISGKAPWVKGNIVSLRIEAGICRELADIAVNEMTAGVDKEALDAQFQSGIKDLNENLQDGLALGSFILKPLGDGRSEFVSADKFIPVSFGDDGVPRDVMFLTRKRTGESSFYTRVERHRFDEDGNLTIDNKCYHSTSETDIGTRCSFLSVPEWAETLESVVYPGMTKNDYGYFRVPLKNRIDWSPCGASIYFEAVEAIRHADVQYGRLDWEYQSGERAIHVDERALLHKSGKVSLPSGTQRLYRGLNLDQNGGELYKEYSPTMRDEAFLRGIEKAYRNIEFIIGLGYGDLSDASEVDKTATEIRASKQRKYNRVSAIQENLKSCLSDYVDALAFYSDMLNSPYEFKCTFSDSVLTDEETERTQDREDVAMGVMDPAEYRAKWYGEDIETARQNLPAQSSVLL